MHSLLGRQIKKYFGPGHPFTEECMKFLDAVDQAYKQFDEDRAMLERSMELSSQELLQVNLEARQREKMAAVGQLAAGVAHEINNPLGVILGFAQSALKRISEDHIVAMPLKAIEREALRCKNLVQDLLTFSRASRQEQEQLQLNVLVRGAISLIEAQAKIRQAVVCLKLQENLPEILGHQNQLQQVVINLAGNAMDAMPQGGTITVQTELVEEKNQAWVCLRVSDTGTGIPEDVLPKIFEPFFTTKAVGKGTGLGLSLVYEIVSKHSGKLEVKSRPGNTEFCVKFPVPSKQEKEGG